MSTAYVNRQQMHGKRYVPLVRVSFHTEAACYQTTGNVVGMDEPPDPTDQVLAVTTQKTLASPAGAFSITLAGIDWLSRLESNDLVVVQMGYKGVNGTEEMSTVMVGLIDTVTRTRAAGDGQPVVNTRVMCRDFGKLLIRAGLKFYPELGWSSGGEKFFLTESGWITLMQAFTSDNLLKGTPAKILDTVMRFILQKIMSVSWKVYDEAGAEPVPKTVELAHVLRYNFAEVPVFLPLMLTAQEYEGSVWNLMERASIKPFTELFVDVRDGVESWNNTGAPMVVNETIEEGSTPEKADSPKDQGGYASPRFSFGSDNAAVMVVLRNTPFDKSNWEKLKTHVLQDADVITDELSKSDNEHYNLFWAGTTITPFDTLDLKRVAPPLMNEENVKRYGLCPLEASITGLELLKEEETEQSVALEGLSRKYTAKLRAWYEDNHKYLSGSLDVRGKGDYKIGQRLIYDGMEFYIEGVSQTFNVFTSWTTSLSLTRGMRIGSAPDSAVYAPKSVQKEATSASTTEQDVYYTVKSGDSLWSIAGMSNHYGDSTQWTRIWEANKDMLIQRDSRNEASQGKWLYAGQILRIPK